MKKRNFIKNIFLLPILLVVIISIFHTITWFEIGNIHSWAIYLSVAIEIFALTSLISVASGMNKISVWVLFVIVVLIQLIGNVYYTYSQIDVNSIMFKNWTELIEPFVYKWSLKDHKIFLAYIQGGVLPLLSLLSLHFYISYDTKSKKIEKIDTDIINKNVIDITIHFLFFSVSHSSYKSILSSP